MIEFFFKFIKFISIFKLNDKRASLLLGERF